MSSRDEQKLLAFVEDLAALIDRHTPTISETDIAFALEVLAEHMHERAEDSEQRTRAETPLVHDSTALFEPNSEAEEAYAPTSEVHQDPPTVQIPEEPLEIFDAEAAVLTPAPAGRDRERAGTFPAQPPPIPIKPSAPGGDRRRESTATPAPPKPASPKPASPKPPSAAEATPYIRQRFDKARAAYSRKTEAAKAGAVAKFEGMQIIRRLSLSYSLNCLGLKLYERPLVDRVLASPRPFDEVVQRSPLPRDATAGLLKGLDAIDLLDVQPITSGVRPSRPTLAHTPGGVLSHLDALAARLERENCFDLLGVHWAAHQAQIERRRAEFDDLLAGLGQGEILATGVRERVTSIRARLGEVGQRLGDASGRRAHRRELVDSSTRGKTARKLSMLADAAFKRKAFEDALDFYRCLLELVPDHPRARRLAPVLQKRVGPSTTDGS
jgi:hypothetical protein